MEEAGARKLARPASLHALGSQQALQVAEHGPDRQPDQAGGVQFGRALTTSAVAKAGEGQAEVDKAQRCRDGRCEHLPCVCKPTEPSVKSLLNIGVHDTSAEGPRLSSGAVLFHSEQHQGSRHSAILKRSMAPG
jgi:hypothetical protein